MSFRRFKGWHSRIPRLLIASALVVLCWAPSALAHRLKFTGVSLQQGRLLQSKFPHVFEREITLAEVDDLVRYLMKTGLYSGINVVSRQTGEGPELLLVATQLRKISRIEVVGNRAFSTGEVKQILQIDERKTLERKELIEAIKNLQAEYRKRGYRSMNAEVEFKTSGETEVEIRVVVEEGLPTKIDKIQIDTANPELQARVEKKVRSLKGKVLNEEELQAMIHNIDEDLKDQRYLVARIADPVPTFTEKQEHVRVNINIENPWQYKFEFSGSSSVSDSTLIKNMNLDQLTGTVSTPAPELAERLRRYYQDQGYAHIQVKTEEKQNDARFLRSIRFEIEEGPRVRIKKINVAGNISRSGDYYARYIKSSSSDLIGDGYYNRKDIEEGIKNLEEELQNQGYLRAKVKAWRSEFGSGLTSSPDDKKYGSQATLFLTIDEGPLTVIRQIRFEGVDAFSKLQLLALLPIKTNESLRIKDLNNAIENLKTFYSAEGFIEMKILNEHEGLVVYNEASTQATILFKIAEGPKVTVGSIVLQGNESTKDDVILRELGFKRGDVFTPAVRDDSAFHLNKLKLFSRVSIRTLEEGTSIAQRTVLVELEESPPGSFESGIGIAQDRDLEFRGFAGVAYRNLGGMARSISSRIDPSYSTNSQISYLEHKITLSYLEPYILGDRNYGRVNLVRELKFSGDFDSITKNAIIQEENALALQVERDFTRNIRLNFTAYTLSSQNLFDRVTYEIKRTQNIAKVGPLIAFDYRDNPLYPTKGSYSYLSLEYSDPLLGSSEDVSQQIKFLKATASTSYPYRISGNSRWILATSFRTGYVVNMGDRSNSIPWQEAFFLGGRSTLRGFDGIDRDRVPNRYQLGVENLRDFYVSSDSYYFLLKSELRFPLFWIMDGAIFYDGGAVLLSQLPIDDPYRDTAGLALRFGFTGGIYLSFEYGFKLDRKLWAGAHENPGAFHMAIGTF